MPSIMSSTSSNFEDFVSWRLRLRLAAYGVRLATPSTIWLRGRLLAGNVEIAIVSALYLLSFGLIYFTPFWRSLDAFVEKACDFRVFPMLFDMVQVELAGYTRFFGKVGFSQLCSASDLPAPEEFRSLREIFEFEARSNGVQTAKGRANVDLFVKPRLRAR